LDYYLAKTREGPKAVKGQKVSPKVTGKDAKKPKVGKAAKSPGKRTCQFPDVALALDTPSQSQSRPKAKGFGLAWLVKPQLWLRGFLA
jgi:hypothetical protein